MSDTHAHTPKSPESRVPLLRYVVLAMLLAWVVGYARYKSAESETKADADKVAIANYAATHPQAPAAAAPSPSIVFATTPATITANYAYSLETDGETILVKYPDEAPFKYHGKCAKLPEPRYSGPKVFTDPKDPVNGHINFRLYPIRMGDVPPNCPGK